MSSTEDIDRQLAFVLDEVITAIQTTKQAVWSASNAEVRQALSELKTFLGEQAAVIFDAEVDVEEPSSSVVSPTGRTPRNLKATAGQDHGVFRTLVLGELRAVAVDVRARAAAISDSPHAMLLTRLADGLDERLDALAKAAAQG